MPLFRTNKSYASDRKRRAMFAALAAKGGLKKFAKKAKAKGLIGKAGLSGAALENKVLKRFAENVAGGKMTYKKAAKKKSAKKIGRRGGKG